MEGLKDYYDEDFTDAGMSEIKFSPYGGVPSKKQCDRICAEMFGEVVVWKRKKPSF